MVDATELDITTVSDDGSTSVDALTLAETIFGSGIEVVSATYEGNPFAAGIYTNGNLTSPDVMPSDSGVILSTGMASDFTNASGNANQDPDLNPILVGEAVDGDPDLNAVTGGDSFDGAILTAEFIPEGSVLTMQIVFSSEEYLNFVGASVNDAVVIVVNGVPAELTVGNGEISVDNVNPDVNGDLYVDNPASEGGVFNTEMDGFTVTLTLKAIVIPGEVNTIKIGIADGGDRLGDSNLLIAADSVQTAVVAVDDTFTLDANGEAIVNLIANDISTSGQLSIIEINGQRAANGSEYVLPSGVRVKLGGDGNITVITDQDTQTGDASFSYTVVDETGLITDVGFVTGRVPCFVEGARIETARGLVPVEEVRVGDLVLTLDEGFKPVIWRGSRRVDHPGSMAAVRIPAGMFGAHAALAVSPQHRLFLTGWRAELYCGCEEVLVKAAHLVRAGRLQQDAPDVAVTYHHLMFDRHQIINSEGLWSESYHPGPETLADHDAETLDELLTLFPQLARDPANGYGPIARPEATAQAAALLA